MKNHITINPAFQNLLPALTAEEFSSLEEQIIADGCREPLVLWPQKDGSSVLVDGHNRYKICTEHELAYAKIDHKFDSEDEAKVWIIEDSFGRRNLNDYQRGKLVLMRKAIVAKQAKERQVAAGGDTRKKALVPNLAQAEPCGKTRDTLAKLAKVSHGTICNVEAVEENGIPELKQAAEAGRIKVEPAARISRLEPAQQRELVAIDDAPARRMRLRQLEMKPDGGKVAHCVTLTLSTIDAKRTAETLTVNLGKDFLHSVFEFVFGTERK